MQKSSMREVSQIKGTNQQEAKGAIVDTKKGNFIESIIIGMNKGKLMNKSKEELVAMFLAQQASHLKPVISGKLSTCSPKSLTLLAAEKLEQSIRRPAVKSVRDKIKNFEEKAIKNTKPSIIRLDSQSVSLQAYKI